VRFSRVAGDSDLLCRQGRKEGGNCSIPLFAWTFLQRRLSSRAASCGRAWKRCAATFPADPKRLSNNSWIFGVYFIIFELYLIYFEFLLFL